MAKQGFFKRWVEGMKNLSPRRQVESQIAFAWGNLFGFFGAFVTTLYSVIFVHEYKNWWLPFILVIIFCSTIVDLIGKKQLLKQMVEAEKSVADISEARL